MAHSLAEMFGAIGLRMFPGDTMIMFSESDSPPVRRVLDGESDMKCERCHDLMESLVMQSSIGK